MSVDPTRLRRFREQMATREASLHPLATRDSAATRQRAEEADPIRLAFQVDRDRVIHTRAFRRLKHKTQVFVHPDSDHVVTRMTHTIEVQQVARTIARALNLNEDLAEAIGFAHDLGHTPFGHAGEEQLAALLPEGFRHNEQSLRIVDLLENGGRGLNLTDQTREGILKHSKTRDSVASEAWGVASTLEGQIVKLADSIAYLDHDIQDALRAELVAESQLPSVARSVLGGTHSERVAALVTDCVLASAGTFEGAPRIRLSDEVLAATDVLREFMFERVYLHPEVLKEAEHGQQIVELLFSHYEERPEQIPGWSLPDDPPWRRAADYVSGMTDGYALWQAHSLGLIR
ncbi:MAG: deoxyguanosinetriphosphate triphosphohydrolase [Dehalococcoidia bacterium]|nr:deoxyguanosinetriphosphate triphosphohydrolase [Dehalococcoidia bacterium]